MFTGLVAEVGTLAAVSSLASGVRLRIAAQLADEKLDMGESIAVDGCCLTLIGQGAGWFETEVSHESLACTNLGEKNAGSRVNLERALRLGDRLGGHWVQGHVDGVGGLAAIRPVGESHEIEVALPDDLRRYVVEKGSLTVSGVSLTVNRLLPQAAAINLIRHTWENTTLGQLPVGSKMNLEVDILAKYAESLLAPYRSLR